MMNSNFMVKQRTVQDRELTGHGFLLRDRGSERSHFPVRYQITLLGDDVEKLQGTGECADTLKSLKGSLEFLQEVPALYSQDMNRLYLLLEDGGRVRVMPEEMDGKHFIIKGLGTISPPGR